MFPSPKFDFYLIPVRLTLTAAATFWFEQTLANVDSDDVLYFILIFRCFYGDEIPGFLNCYNPRS